MFAIACVHRTGGGTTATGETIEDVKKNADNLMAMPHIKGSYIFCSIPYEVHKVKDTNIMNTSFPSEWKLDIKEMAGLFSGG